MPGVQLVIALVALTGGGDAVASGYPLRFDGEVVRLFVEADSLRVEGHYHFRCGESAARAVTLLYPYPADSLLGGARTLRLEARAPGGDWQPLTFAEMPGRSTVRWLVPLDLAEQLELRTTYRQALRGRYARYIVTTTAAWNSASQSRSRTLPISLHGAPEFVEPPRLPECRFSANRVAGECGSKCQPRLPVRPPRELPPGRYGRARRSYTGANQCMDSCVTMRTAAATSLTADRWSSGSRNLRNVLK